MATSRRTTNTFIAEGSSSGQYLTLADLYDFLEATKHLPEGTTIHLVPASIGDQIHAYESLS